MRAVAKKAPKVAREDRSLSVIVPVYNEEKLVFDGAQKIASFMNSAMPGKTEVILCDNGSTDGTFRESERAAKLIPGVRAKRVPKKGLGAGLKLGIASAKKSVIAFYPIDCSFDMEHVITAANKIFSGDADIVIGSKGHKDSVVRRSVSRRIASFIYNTLIRLAFRTGIRDTQGTMIFWRRDAQQMLPSIAHDDAFFQAEFLISAKRRGLRIIEIPVRVDDRRKGSKFSIIRDGAKMFLDILRFRKSIAK